MLDFWGENFTLKFKMNNEKEFKTKFFKEGITLIEEDFKKDFNAFLEVPGEVAECINDIYKERESFFRGRERNIRLISKKTRYDPAKINQVLLVISNFTKYLEKEESLDDLLSDLLQREYVSEEEIEKAKEKIKILSDAIEYWRRRREEINAEGWGAPEFYGCSTAADLRLQPKKAYDVFEDIEEYDPQKENLIPMGLIEMRIKKYSGEESFSFQVNLEEVRILKNALLSLEKELLYLDEIAKKYK